MKGQVKYKEILYDAKLIFKSSDLSGQTRADQVIVNSFMTVFAYLFGEYRSFLSAIDPATGERKLQVQKEMRYEIQQLAIIYYLMHCY